MALGLIVLMWVAPLYWLGNTAFKIKVQIQSPTPVWFPDPVTFENLQWVYDHTGQNQKGKMVSLATETDRTLFFDFLPLDLGTVRGFKTRFHLYTVPGQVFYEASRKLILKGADGVVFVADSQEERLDANFETMENLQEHLKEHNLNFDTIPYVLQLNKRDLPNAMPVPELKKQLQKKGEPVLEGVAIQGIGVFETLKEVAKLVLAELKKGG